MAETRVILEVAPGLNQWAWSDPDDALVLAAGGRHALKGDDLSEDALAAIASAVSAGSLILIEADASSRAILNAIVEPEKESLKAQEAADEIRAEILSERDDALDELSRARAGALEEIDDDDEDALADEAASYLAERDQILAEYDNRADSDIRARLTEKDA